MKLKDGWYYVKFNQYNKEDESDPDYFEDWIELIDGKWEYGPYEKYAIVCEIIRGEDELTMRE